MYEPFCYFFFFKREIIVSDDKVDMFWSFFILENWIVKWRNQNDIFMNIFFALNPRWFKIIIKNWSAHFAY